MSAVGQSERVRNLEELNRSITTFDEQIQSWENKTTDDKTKETVAKVLEFLRAWRALKEMQKDKLVADHSLQA